MSQVSPCSYDPNIRLQQTLNSKSIIPILLNLIREKFFSFFHLSKHLESQCRSGVFLMCRDDSVVCFFKYDLFGIKV